MGKIRTTIQNFSLRMDTLEKKVFWLIASLSAVAGLVCTIITIFENIGIGAVMVALACALIPLVAMYLCDKLGKYPTAYALLCIALNVIMIPFSLFTNGGIHSGMPIIMAGAMVLIGFTFDVKRRMIMAGITLFVNTAAMIISLEHPELVTLIEGEGMVEFDIISCFVFISIGMLVMISMVMAEYKAAILKEKRLADQKADIRYEMMEAQNENVEAVRRMRHDARHHNAIIMEMLQNEQYEELKKYMQQKMGDEEKYATVIYCMNSTVNSVLSVYTRKANKAGIETEINADVPADIDIKETDIVAMLSNIYENAIHGAQAAESAQKKITVSIHPKDDRLVIRCSNTCESSLELFNGFPAAGPGTGIRSVLEAAKNYDGQLMYNIDHNELICRLVVSIH